MNMKKTTALLLSAMLCACMVTGCGGKNGGGSSSAASQASASSSAVSTDEKSADENSKDEKSADENSKDEKSADEKSAGDESSEGEQSSKEEKSEEASTEKSDVSVPDIGKKDYRNLDADYTVENGVVVVNQDGHYRAMELFGGGSGDAYVDSLNALRSSVGSDVSIYSMIIPLSCEYYLPANYSDYSAEQKEYFDDINGRLADGITKVDALSTLAQHTAEPIYCRTDHHWMPLGAYYATQAFADAAGVAFKELSTFTPVTVEGFVGTMYAFTDGDINIKNDPEDFTYYVPDNYEQCHTDFYDTSFNFDYTGTYFKEVGDPQSNAYLTFFGGDEQIVKIRTNVKNGKKLLVVKDSYGNAEPGYLMNSFEEIYIVDMRYFKLNLIRFINDLSITDVLFTMCTFSAFGSNSYELPGLLTQAPDEPVIDTYDR